MVKTIKKAKTAHNAANYLALNFGYTTGNTLAITNTNFEAEPGFVILPKWGFNSYISPKINFNFAIGTGYGWKKSKQGGIIALGLKFSYYFKKNSKSIK